MAELKEPTEIITVTDPVVACDGGGGALGHPKVYLNITTDGVIDCPYCGRRYVLQAGASAGHH
ncbi:MAG TPA: zinc-finger domain-containing protein [Candidatus Sulfotelmatobacter sp.]|nr:zinc-finger domain-containing protein [Candidatus Sulfotelmatobacter sp.]